ncbi:C2H2 type zinc finger domain protein [Penicillium malachiteum]|uniref:C2H2 type zinc finger domain protein n=1 Tax=Penicillium malachiteum TaxID=1324776 RepID=UPI0025465939|nr:C2H2 type zinc finger domain protein [Penicillium malachiteum]KAJ5721902.1 C2H2 type zinc finger domain protein [Penicillium malachiteum]
MTDDPVNVPLHIGSLSSAYRHCFVLYGKFLLALDRKDRDSTAISLDQTDVAQIIDGYGRAKIWGNQTKVVLPERARGSLDDTLRYDDELKSLVRGILIRLGALLDQVTRIIQRESDADESDGSLSSVSAESDSDGKVQPPKRIPRIRLLVQQILAQIRSLFDLSSLLRRPKLAGRYITSVNTKAKERMISVDTLPLATAFTSLDESHILEKVLQWRGLTKSGRDIEFEGEEVAPVNQTFNAGHIEDISWFCERFARANTRRREQLQHWTDHPYDVTREVTNAIDAISEPDPEFSARKGQRLLKDEESASQAQGRSIQSQAPKSTTSKAFSLANRSDVFDTKTNTRSRTIYAPTTIGQGRSNSVPDPPKTIEEDIFFTCPYCKMKLDSSEMKNRQSWKRHVFRDLRPYVCTFDNCQNAGKLYVSRHEWIYHELQIHRRKFVCQECDKAYPGRKELAKHLDQHHAGSIPPNRLEIFLDLCERQIDLSDDQIEACLICGQELTLHELQGHIGGHMEDLALFVLPSTSEDNEEQGSKASVQVVKLNSQGSKSEYDSELSFDTLSEHASPQDLAEFSDEDAADPSSLSKEIPTLHPDNDWMARFDPRPPQFQSQLSGLASGISVPGNASTKQLTEDDDITNITLNHWAVDIFSSIASKTRLPGSFEKGECFGDNHVGLKQILQEQGFVKLFQLVDDPGSESDFNVDFYLREKDLRARIMCKVKPLARPSEHFCLSLNKLEVIRKESYLQLCRRRNSGNELVLWARIPFTTMESLVVTFCTFLALRSADKGWPVEDIRDYYLDGEEELYGGKFEFVEDCSLYALRVFRDEISGAVRLQASVYDGPKKNAPVWTAFITHHLNRNYWLKVKDERTVIVPDLKPIIFMMPEDYTPETTENGEHILKFTSKSAVARGGF